MKQQKHEKAKTWKRQFKKLKAKGHFFKKVRGGEQTYENNKHNHQKRKQTNHT